MRLLVAEDDPQLLKSLRHIFESYKYIVDAVSTGTEAYSFAVTGEYDGLVLDIMMPGMDGIEVLKRIRHEGICTPALFLSARTEIYQKVEGLDAGADDYLPKPFSTSELLARVRAIIRRKNNYIPDLLAVGDLVLNRSTFEICENGRSQILSSKEFQIMEMLMQRPNFIIPTDEFMSHIWGWNNEVNINVIRFIRDVGYILEKSR
jgi:two-component system response regulator ArlR